MLSKHKQCHTLFIVIATIPTILLGLTDNAFSTLQTQFNQALVNREWQQAEGLISQIENSRTHGNFACPWQLKLARAQGGIGDAETIARLERENTALQARNSQLETKNAALTTTGISDESARTQASGLLAAKQNTIEQLQKDKDELNRELASFKESSTQATTILSKLTEAAIQANANLTPKLFIGTVEESATVLNALLDDYQQIKKQAPTGRKFVVAEGVSLSESECMALHASQERITKEKDQCVINLKKTKDDNARLQLEKETLSAQNFALTQQLAGAKAQAQVRLPSTMLPSTGSQPNPSLLTPRSPTTGIQWNVRPAL